ncbi:C1 family peptidase [Microcoleus sp. herbarium5]|uniref:C1 family peptidase n=1 Tax=Microcoleus sp. herbarium5 TaxID=3055434 RepID=UPI002FCFFA46
METKKTANNQAKDWRKQGLGWVPDYPDQRDYLLDSEEVKKSGNSSRNSSNLRRNEVTKSIEDIAESLIKLITTVEKIGQETLEDLKTKLESKIFDDVIFVPVKVYSESLKLNITQSPNVRQLKYYFHLLSSHPTLSDHFPPKNFLDTKGQEYWKWLQNENFDENTQKIVEEFQKQAKIRVDGVVGVETYAAIGNFLGDINYSPLKKAPPLANLLPIPISIKPSIFKIIFDTLKSWKISFSTVDQDNIRTFFPGMLEGASHFWTLAILNGPETLGIWLRLGMILQNWDAPDSSQWESEFFEMFKQEFYVVEPLVSAITEIISPFAIHNDLESALKTELNKFPNLNESTLQTALNKFPNFEEKFANSFFNEAILEVNSRLKIELEEIKKEIKIPAKTGPEKSKLDLKLKIKTFYEIIHCIVGEYIKANSLSRDQKLLNSFSAPYLFEIEEDKEENEDCKKQNKNQKKTLALTDSENIIPVKKLDLLVNRKWYEKYKKKLAEENIKPYAILPSVVDLSFWCSPIRDQGSLNSCTAFAAAALLEYFARKAKDEYTSISPLFLYKVARNLMNSTGDVGASVRETMKTMVAFGVPPEKYWSYEADKFDEEPPAFCYSYAQSYKTLKYFRLDRPDVTKEILLFQIQAVLAADFPCIFGFTVYSSIYNKQNISSGCIPYPSKKDQVIGGHTVLAVGYNNYKKIKYFDGEEKITTGAFLIRNSWGTEWGQQGYGWLPYDYVLKGLTADWWSLLKAEWFDAGNFGLGAHAPGEKCKKGEIGC